MPELRGASVSVPEAGLFSSERKEHREIAGSAGINRRKMGARSTEQAEKNAAQELLKVR